MLRLQTQAHDPDPAFGGRHQPMRLPLVLLLLLAIPQQVAVQAQHSQAGVFAHALADAWIEQPYHRQAGRQPGQVQLVDPRRQGKQHLEIGQSLLQVFGRLPGGEVVNVFRVADIRPGAPFDIRGMLGEQRSPLFTAHGVSFIEERHGHFLSRERGRFMMPEWQSRIA